MLKELSNQYYHNTYVNYFGQSDNIIIYTEPCKKSHLLTQLRKIGDKMGQYVTNLRYCDMLYFSYDNDEIRSKLDDDEIVWSYYHSECDFCKEFKHNVKNNDMIGIEIHPSGSNVKRYYERKKHWNQFITKC